MSTVLLALTELTLVMATVGACLSRRDQFTFSATASRDIAGASVAAVPVVAGEALGELPPPQAASEIAATA
jgi:hypothetical protein